MSGLPSTAASSPARAPSSLFARLIARLDFIEFLGRILDAADRAARFAGPLFLFGASIIISCSAAMYFRFVAPDWGLNLEGWVGSTGDRGGYEVTVTGLLVTGVGLFGLGNLLYNYHRCVVADPGSTVGLRYRAILDLGDSACQLLPPQASHEVKICHVCNAPKPRRVHHCSVCDKCVIKMGAWGVPPSGLRRGPVDRWT
jgi:hypothetical protein